MKKVLKVIGIVFGLAVVGALGAMAYVKLALPDVGSAPDMKVEITPARLARGEYLAQHVALCADCHSARDYTRFAAPPMPGTLGMGGEIFDQKMGFPGSFPSKNITPYGIGEWTDGEIYRAITTGVSRDGHAFFPVMPYPYYGRMNEEDAKSIVAYLRTLKPIESTPAASVADFPMNFILNTIPQKANPMPLPAPGDELATGEYLTIMAGCAECHTPAERGQIDPARMFSGGRIFELPTGTLHSANITPDKETGLGNWTKEAFVARFRAYADSGYSAPKVGPNEMQTIMPWTMYGGMKPEDLGAIYTYLMTVQPVKNLVPEKFNPREKVVAAR